MKGLLWLAVFWTMQVVAVVLFKYGTTAPGRYWLGFLAGNLFGASSIFILMKLYSMWQVNVAGALAGGGAFLLGQFAMIPIFKEHLSFRQVLGIVAISIGMALVSYGKVNPSPADTPKQGVVSVAVPQVSEGQ